MVNGVKRERLHEGRQLQTMGGSVGGRRVRPRQAGAEINNYGVRGGRWLPLLCLASRRDCYGRNNREGNNKIFPFGQGKHPEVEGK